MPGNTACNPVKVSRLLRGTFCLRFGGTRIISIVRQRRNEEWPKWFSEKLAGILATCGIYQEMEIFLKCVVIT
jgi:hypothetical protein